jgi:hypothetical protein
MGLAGALLLLAFVAVAGCSDKSAGSSAGGTADATKRTATVWAVGDGADGGKAAARVAGLIQRDNPDRVLYLGDVYEQGTRGEFDSNYAPTFGKFAKRTAPTPGNHDWPNHTDGYEPYWRDVTGRTPRSYYTFSIAGWQLIGLNSESEHGASSPQVRWLRSKVSANRNGNGSGNCRIAFWHRPRFNAGRVHGDQPDVAPFWNALRGHAAIVLNGHEHDMQRFKPRDGITEFVSGAGGHLLYRLHKGDSRLAFGDSSQFGALRLALSPGSASYRFVSVSGRTLDSGRLGCRRR